MKLHAFFLVLLSSFAIALTEEQCGEQIENYDVAVDVLFKLVYTMKFNTFTSVQSFLSETNSYGLYKPEFQDVEFWKKETPKKIIKHPNYFYSNIYFGFDIHKKTTALHYTGKGSQYFYCVTVHHENYGELDLCCLIDEAQESDYCPDVIKGNTDSLRRSFLEFGRLPTSP